ncbi:MAG TPA: NfeD family protein [Gemmataceae bacterium]|jgi:membrane-bound ClpP family serine protease|nr:NfeD family protein [Gemmataceae bacterium]
MKRALWLIGVLSVCLAAPSALRAQAPVREEGLFIALQPPISRDVVNRVKAATERALEAKDPPIRKIVYDFNPGGRASTSTDYGDCRDLADYLLKRRTIKTIAFVHGEVTGHAVLPVLACQEIVMSRDALLGDALRGSKESLEEDQIRFYENVSRGRKPTAVILKMVDPAVSLVEAARMEGGGAKTFIDARRRAEEQKRGILATNKEPIVPAGAIALYDTMLAQQLGLCDLSVESRNAIVEAYSLTPNSLRGDPLEGRDPIAERVVINEPFTRALQETLERRMRQAIGRRGVNAFVLRLESSSGDTLAARDFAEFLRKLKEDQGGTSLLTIAYVPDRAPGALAIVAMGCTDIAMAPRAEFGDFEPLLQQRGRGEPGERFNMLQESMVGLAHNQGYSELAVRGMLDPELVIYRVHSQKGAAQWRLLTDAELATDQAGPRVWDEKSKMLIKPAGRLLKMDANIAKELGFCRHIVPGEDELYQIYGLKKVRDISFDFLYDLAKFLRYPLVSIVLIMVGVTGLILELKMPGVSFPGIVAALCFVLYFWAQSQLAGQIIMLAILLFVLGLILIVLEIFVLPGFGMAGISGIVLVVISLGLATLEKRPETSVEWMSFGRTLGGVGLGLLGAMGLAGVVAWYLPNIPYANRLVLRPPQELSEDEELGGESVPGHLASLLGAIGSAATTLRPAGIARFGDRFVDVVSEGNLIEMGSRVQVVEIEGNRIVVKEI